MALNTSQQQSAALIAALSHPDPEERWKAIWSIETSHDPSLVMLRLRHFHRFQRAVPDENQDIQSTAIFFPGTSGSHDAKCAWSGVVHHELYDNDKRPAFDTSWPRDADIPEDIGPIVSEILLKSCPETVSVQILIDRKRIEYFLRPVTIQETEGSFYGSNYNSEEQAGLDNATKLLSSSYLRDDVPPDVANPSEGQEEDDVQVRLDKFRQWLPTATPGTTVHNEPILTKLPPQRYDWLSPKFPRATRDSDLVLLARRDGVPKGANIQTVLRDMVESLGLHPDAVSLRPTDSRNPDVHGMAYMMRELVGEHLHFPDADGTHAVAFTWTSNRTLTEQDLARKRRFETAFVRNVEAKKEASNGQLCPMLWPHHPSAEGTHPEDVLEVTAANTFLLWMPGDYDKIEECIFDHCLNGDGEERETKRRLKSGTTDAGNVFWDIVRNEFEFSIKGVGASSVREFETIEDKWSLKLCLLLALTRTLGQAGHLLLDHEHPPKDIEEFMGKVAALWRMVLGKDNKTLGLGLAEDEPASRDSSREALYAMLKFYASNFEDQMGSCGINVHFDCIPKSKGGQKRKANVEL